MTNDLETPSRPPVGSTRQPVSVLPSRGELVYCLIVSGCPLKRSEFTAAAREAGWETIVCTDETAAMAAVRRTRFQMAWVDLESSETTCLREVCQSIASLDQVLLVVCGHEHAPQEEIWARQLGVWLYLPGLALGHEAEIQMLCEQGYLVADSMRSTH